MTRPSAVRKIDDPALSSVSFQTSSTRNFTLVLLDRRGCVGVSLRANEGAGNGVAGESFAPTIQPAVVVAPARQG
jgi:hypothetical protein